MMTAAWGVLLPLLMGSSPLVLAVGANDSVVTAMPPLHYADDDAVAAAALFGDPSRVWLAATLDEDSAKVFPQWDARAVPPTLKAVTRLVDSMAKVLAAEPPEHKSTVVVWLVGHGGHDATGNAFVALQDTALTAAVLERVILRPLAAAAYIHVVVDACHAGGLVASRMAASSITQEEATRGFGQGITLPPNVGFVLAAAASERTYESASLGGGLFSAVVRSGLRGAANLDGSPCITYEELNVFSAAAWHGVALREARPHIVLSPPGQRQGAELSCPNWFHDQRPLQVTMDTTSTFRVEDAAGVWLAGGRFEAGHPLTIILPPGLPLAWSSEQQVRPLVMSDDGLRYTLGAPHAVSQLFARSTVEEALEQGLFKVPFGGAFASGYQAAHANQDRPRRVSPRPPSRHLLMFVSVPPGLLSVAALMSLGMAVWVYAAVQLGAALDAFAVGGPAPDRREFWVNVATPTRSAAPLVYAMFLVAMGATVAGSLALACVAADVLNGIL